MEKSNFLKCSFAPIADKDSKVLLLGTMPGQRSLKLQQYYGHKRNHFWKIIFHLFDKPFTDDYERKIELLLSNKIALWDVLQTCEGKGSLDSNIKMKRRMILNISFAFIRP
jgi:hypoxanthine-DNA glycosylase